MFRRIAHLFGFRKKDEALEKRFAQIKARYLEASLQSDAVSDPIGHMRITGNFDKRTVTGASTATKERITQSLLESCARAVEKTSELAGTTSK
jgi:hypothetical protein